MLGYLPPFPHSYDCPAEDNEDCNRRKDQDHESVAPKWKELLDFDPEGQTLELIEANNQLKGCVA